MFDFTGLFAQAEPSGFVKLVDSLARAPISQVVGLAVVLTIVRLAVWPYLKNTPPHQRFGAYTFAKLVNEVCDAIVYAGIVVFLLVRPFGIQTFYIPSGSMIDTLHLNDYIVANKWVYRFNEPKHGDIVVFKPPKEALFPGQGDTDFIKRLIGKPGDLIEWKNRQLYRNGQPVNEPYVDYTFPGQPNGDPMPVDEARSIRQADFKLVDDNGLIVPVQYSAEAVNMYPTGSSYEDINLMSTAERYRPHDRDQALKWRSLPAARVPEGYYFFMGDNRNGSFDSRGWGLVPRDSIIGKSEFIWFPFYRWRATR